MSPDMDPRLYPLVQHKALVTRQLRDAPEDCHMPNRRNQNSRRHGQQKPGRHCWKALTYVGHHVQSEIASIPKR